MIYGWTNGCFDLLHPGHVDFLRRARALCGSLAVFLNSDASVARLKGPTRPAMDCNARRAMLLACRYVDRVVVFEEDTPVAKFKALNETPGMYIKEAGTNVEQSVEAAWCLQRGVPIVLLGRYVNASTTSILRSIREQGTVS